MKKKLKHLLLIFCTFNLSSLCLSQSDIVITEIMYNQPGNDTLEYIELYNKGASPISLNGYTFTSGITHTFTNFTLNPSSYVVLSKYANYVNSFYSITSIQWQSGALDNTGEKIVLKNSQGQIIDSVEFETSNTWEDDADGKGPSLALCNAGDDNSLGYNWAAANNFAGIYLGNPIYGTPGKANTSCSAKGDIYAPRVKKAQATNLTTIGIKFDEDITSASAQNKLNYAGLGTISTATLSSPDSVTIVLSQPLQFGKVYTLSINTISDLHSPANVMTSPKNIDLGYNNSIADLKITEIFFLNYGNDTLEFVEVYNAGSQSAQIGGYYFSDGVEFVFPEFTIAQGDYFVIPAHPTIFNQFFSKTLSYDFKGSLNNAGEVLTIKNSVGTIINSVTYNPQWLGGKTGASISLCDPTSNNSISSNWGVTEDLSGSFMGKDIWATPGSSSTNCKIAASINNPENSHISLYPNPSSGIINLTFEDSQSKTIIIYNSLGKVLYKTTTTELLETINLGDIKGLHFVSISDKENIAPKMIKVDFK